MKSLYALCLTACLAVCLMLPAPASAQQSGADPLSGAWSGDWGPSAADRNQVTVDLKWDGKKLDGTVNPGPNAVPLQKASYDAATKAVHFEAEAKGRRGDVLHYVIDGKVQGDTMSGSWKHESRDGDFKLTKKK